MDITSFCDYALYSRIKDLPRRERQIVTLIVDRLHAGVKEYGAWDGRKHDNEKDLLEELLDATVYGSAFLLDLAERGAHE